MKSIIHYLAEKPIIFNILRRIIEANYISLKRVIRKEFSLDRKSENFFSREKVLDVPCGTGEFCTLFTPDCYQGLDISNKYIEYARNRYKLKFICSDARYSSFSDDYFDKILMLGFLHHLDDPTVESVIKEAKRILKPDGTFLLIEDAPTKSSWNLVGQILQKYDIGSNIRSYFEYMPVLEKEFIVKSYYHVKSGFWDYSVFVLSPK